MTLEYDGSDFAGWARQPGLRTVQAEVEKALAVVLRCPLGEVTLTVAGRTDRGVHALEQVASYPGSVASTRSLNALLPDDVVVRSCEAAHDSFDARADASSRAYVYRILTRSGPSVFWRGRALWWRRPLDLDALRLCAAALPGISDFTAFTPTETYHVRFRREVFSAEWTVAGQGEMLEFWIEADTFMRHMNRVLVGTMLEVGGGRRTVESFRALLTGEPRSSAGPTAPPHGLYLLGAGYGGERVLGAGSGGPGAGLSPPDAQLASVRARSAHQ